MEQICAASGKRYRAKAASVSRIAPIARPATAALNRASPATSLLLPRLAGAIPLTVVPCRLATANASIAHFLIQAGAIREGDVPQKWDDALEVCHGALDAWVKRELGHLHCLEPAFMLAASDGSDALEVAKEATQEVCPFLARLEGHLLVFGRVLPVEQVDQDLQHLERSSLADPVSRQDFGRAQAGPVLAAARLMDERAWRTRVAGMNCFLGHDVLHS